MSQLDKVLRRSVAHLDPLDVEGRERVFASAREAMIRLLRVYDPPLTTADINRKIGEFDAITRIIEGESLAAPAAMRPSLLALAAPEGAAVAEPPPVRPPARAILPPPELVAEPEIVVEPEVLEAEAPLEAELEEEAEDYYDEYEDYDPDDDAYFDEEDERRDGLGGFVDRIGWRTIAAAIGGLVLVLALIGGAMLMSSRRGAEPVTAATPAQTEPATGPTEPVAGSTEAAEPSPPAATAAAPAEPPAAGALALETLVLFDGRDPSVFQSAPENPVGFQGDADGGFARVSSSTGSTGARIPVGRGVYERIAGRTVRIVVVARAARTAPATSLRFAYQNGRVLSPWTDAALGPAYAPLSAVWTVPAERGGPENDALIIEPGVPGDDTAADIRSVRIEILQ